MVRYREPAENRNRRFQGFDSVRNPPFPARFAFTHPTTAVNVTPMQNARIMPEEGLPRPGPLLSCRPRQFLSPATVGRGGLDQ